MAAAEGPNSRILRLNLNFFFGDAPQAIPLGFIFICRRWKHLLCHAWFKSYRWLNICLFVVYLKALSDQTLKAPVPCPLFQKRWQAWVNDDDVISTTHSSFQYACLGLLWCKAFESYIQGGTLQPYIRNKVKHISLQVLFLLRFVLYIRFNYMCENWVNEDSCLIVLKLLKNV